MKLLVIGGGAREHALIWKLKQDPRIEKIFCSPGNGGISSLATIVPACAENDWNSYAEFAQRNDIDLTVVGPETPLAAGIVDSFQKKGLGIFGSNKSCARLESSKIFAKNFMKKYGIPTADFEVFDDHAKALDFVFNSQLSRPKHSLGSPNSQLVIKADGLAHGKGVSVCSSLEEAEEAIEKMMVQKVFGKAGEKIVIEKKLSGEELSLIAFCDGKSLKPLPPARDYKRVYDNDQGPNTGGMGALAPIEVPAPVFQQIERRILDPFLKGIQSENLDYRGVIYFGLMLTEAGPFVLEFNVRFGDPETEVVLPLIETELLELFNAVEDQTLDALELKISDASCVAVVCSSGGYPGAFEVHKEISGLDSVPSSAQDLFIFHSGTLKEKNRYFTNGGRVLTVVGKDKTLKEAKRKAYGAVFKLEFNQMHFRNDIAR